MSDSVRTLGDLELGDSVRVRLADGTTVAGTANIIDFDPEERLRVEIEPDDEDERVRYDVRSERTDGEWTTPQARKYEPGQSDWTALGEVSDAEAE